MCQLSDRRASTASPRSIRSPSPQAHVAGSMSKIRFRSTSSLGSPGGAAVPWGSQLPTGPERRRRLRRARRSSRPRARNGDGAGRADSSDAGERPNFGVGELAAGEGCMDGRQFAESPRNPHVLSRGTRAQPAAPGEPLGHGRASEATAPVELCDELQPAARPRVDVGRKRRDLILELIIGQVRVGGVLSFDNIRVGKLANASDDAPARQRLPKSWSRRWKSFEIGDHILVAITVHTPSRDDPFVSHAAHRGLPPEPRHLADRFLSGHLGCVANCGDLLHRVSQRD